MRYRFAKPADLPTLRTFLAAQFRPSESVDGVLIDLWRQLSIEGSLRITVVEDPELGPEKSVQAIGVSAFVQDGFLEEYLDNPYPGLAAEIYERVLDARSPLLSERDVRAANAGEGLNLVMLHFAMRKYDLADERVQQAMVAVNASFFFFYGGYRLRSLIQEVKDLQAAQYMEAGGFHILSDFAEQLGVGDSVSRPYLVGLSKDEVQPSAINPLSFLYHPLRPRIHFAPAEQKLLELALLNESDLEIAQDLGVSPDTVKKTWRRIYQRVTRVTRLLGTEVIEDVTSRGAEKRRHLLDYLRIHLEELRPFAVKQDKGASKLS